MITLDKLFHACGLFAMVGWLLLLFAGRIRSVAGIIVGFFFPSLLAFFYLATIATHWHERTGGFQSLDQVHSLFANPWLLLAGWVHYLAFDLFIGAWQVRDAKRMGLSHFIVIPCLVLTFLFGPIGLLLYLTLRVIFSKGLPDTQQITSGGAAPSMQRRPFFLHE